jgi:hypothetical protein
VKVDDMERGVFLNGVERMLRIRKYRFYEGVRQFLAETISPFFNPINDLHLRFMRS